MESCIQHPPRLSQTEVSYYITKGINMFSSLNVFIKQNFIETKHLKILTTNFVHNFPCLHSPLQSTIFVQWGSCTGVAQEGSSAKLKVNATISTWIKIKTLLCYLLCTQMHFSFPVLSCKNIILCDMQCNYILWFSGGKLSNEDDLCT